MTEEDVTPTEPHREARPPSRRRRTAMVTSRWAASAAVIAAMTVGAASDTDGDDTTPDGTGEATSAPSWGDPPEPG